MSRLLYLASLPLPPNPGENAPTSLLTQPADLMALNSSRSAWSLSRQSLHSLRTSTIARPACRGVAELARQPTALRERDDPLNEPLSDADIEQAKPRWAYTPSGLKAPYGFRLKEAKNPANSIWHVNEDPAKLDEFYERFLGRNGSRMLPEELRWLAVTHKSFDYGRRGFNTKLAFFGRQIMVLETMSGIMTQPNEVEPFFQDPWYREHFRSPALANVDKLSKQRPQDYISIEGLAKVGLQTQLDQVMRWKPRNTANLSESGIDVALCITLFAIVGAVSMQHGGEVASRVAREKILGRMRSRN